MTVESALYPQQLNTAWPQASDMVSEGDNHIRLTKTVIKTTFPNVAGVVSATDVQLSYVTGVTSAIQAQIDSKGAIAGQTWTGTHVFPSTTTIGGLTPTIRGYLETVTSDAQAQLNARALKAGETYSGAHNFTGAVVTVPTATAGDATNQAASTAFVTGAVGAAAATQVADAIHAAPSKATPVDADELGLSDSAASWGLKKLTFANLKAWIGSLFVSKSGDTINGNLNFGGTGRRITGDFSNATVANRLIFQTTSVDGNTNLHVIPNGAAGIAGLKLESDSAIANGSTLALDIIGGTAAQISSSVRGSGEMLPMTFVTGGSERLRIDTSGNVLVTGSGGLGYGVGSGGTVTQETSKSTEVTLNKPSGLITMNNAALAAGATAIFTFNNSSFTSNDAVLLTIVGQVADKYTVRFAHIAEGVGGIATTNNTAGSLSEAIGINFVVVKAARS